MVIMQIAMNKTVFSTNKIKMQTNETKEVRIKNLACYCFDYVKFEDFDFDNILLDEKNSKKLFTTFYIKIRQVQIHCALYSTKQMILLQFIVKVDNQYYLALNV